MKNKSEKPNILFFLSDQHRPDWLGSTRQLPLRTPCVDRIAERGVHFTKAFTTSPLCAPARACLATGRDYPRCGVINNGQNTPLLWPTYYSHLQNAGYQVAGVGKFDLHKPDRDWGLDGMRMIKEYGFSSGIDSEGKMDAIIAYRNNGFSPKGPYMKFLEERGLSKIHLAMYTQSKPRWWDFAAVTKLPDYAYCDNWVAENGMRFLRNFPHGKPWHLVVNFTGPHSPFDVTYSMHAGWEKAEIPPPVGKRGYKTQVKTHRLQYKSESIKVRRRYYAAMIENIDNLADRMIETVAERGELDNTIIVYASDHGEMLGDHGLWGKGLWYNTVTGVPLVISGPGISRAILSKDLISLHDLAATFLDYAGAEPLPDSDSISLRPLLEGKTGEHRDYVLSGLNDWRMIYDGRFKLVTGDAPLPILFNTDEDPDETKDVASFHPDIVKKLSEILEFEESRGLTGTVPRC